MKLKGWLNFFKRGVWISESVKNAAHFLKTGSRAVPGAEVAAASWVWELCLHQQGGTRAEGRSHPNSRKTALGCYRCCAQMAERLSSLGIRGVWSTYTASSVCCTFWLKESRLLSTEKNICNKKSARVNWLIVNWWSKNWTGEKLGFEFWKDFLCFSFPVFNMSQIGNSYI